MYFPLLKLTTAGRNLISQSAYTNSKMVFTKACFGSGTYARYATEDLLQLTALGSKKLDVQFANADYNSDSGLVTLSFNLDNSAITQAFQCTEMGLYARLGDTGTEVLYGYTTNTENPDTLQPYRDGGYVVTTFNVLVVVGNAANVTATVSEATGYVSYGLYRDHVNAKNPHGTRIGDLNVDWSTVTVGYAIPETLTNAAANENVKSLMGKSAKAINDLLFHLSDPNPHNGLGGIEFGTYVGNATSASSYQDVNLGYQPKALFVVGASGNMHDDVSGMQGGLALPGHPVMNRGRESANDVTTYGQTWDYRYMRIMITETGFRVCGNATGGSENGYGGANINGREYRYVAFK